jgi:TldD protein
VLDIAQQAVDQAGAAGADYADARFVREESESVTVRNQEVEGIDRGTSTGLGIRVLAGGYWGFAATARTDGAEVQRTAALAVEIARAASRLPMDPVTLAPVEPARARWSTRIVEDPFDVPLQDKIALLVEATRRMQSVPGLSFGEGLIDSYRKRQAFASTEGAAIEQTVVNSGGSIAATALGDSDMQRRTYPGSSRGGLLAAGYEHVRSLGLLDHAERVATEAVELLTAPECPSEVTTLVLDGEQLMSQVHESVGHPLELDRVLGMEEAYAGTSFVGLGDRGRLRYGSDLVTIVADATMPQGLGTFGYDDEGVPAQRVVLVENGIFRNFISSRETASVFGDGARSAGAMRADGWQNLPLIRMTNINLLPGEGTLEEIIGDTRDGVFMTTNQSWSIDDKRVNFQFGCELARRIKDGKLTGLYKNPNYTGITTRFWGSCDAVGGREEWRVWGTPNCGKGQPGQVARVGHGTSPGRFRDVQVGVR